MYTGNIYTFPSQSLLLFFFTDTSSCYSFQKLAAGGAVARWILGFVARLVFWNASEDNWRLLEASRCFWKLLSQSHGCLNLGSLSLGSLSPGNLCLGSLTLGSLTSGIPNLGSRS